MPRPKGKTILIGVALFFAFLLWRFPYRNLRGYVYGQIYKTTQIRVDSEDLSPVFFGWPGVALYNATVGIPMGRTSEIEIQAKQITARVGIGSLFPPAPSLSLYFYGLQKGGNLYAKGSQSKTSVSGTLSAEQVNLSPFLTAGLPEPIQGLLSASGSFNYDLNDLAKSTGVFDLKVDKLKIPGMNLEGIVLPAVAWDQVIAKIEMKNGSLDIVQCQFGSPKSDFHGTLSGAVRLGRDWWSSTINVLLKVQLSEQYRNDPQTATLTSFLKTFETAPGEYALKWNATPAEMSTNLMLALPQKP
ncbi:type II secretion system protein GspN [bacterium]|nr:type II secretion system protein GspN [bacterium]